MVSSVEIEKQIAYLNANMLKKHKTHNKNYFSGSHVCLHLVMCAAIFVYFGTFWIIVAAAISIFGLKKSRTCRKLRLGIFKGTLDLNVDLRARVVLIQPIQHHHDNIVITIVLSLLP